MLRRKMARDMRKNLFPFISILLLSFMALFLYSGIEGSNIGIKQIREKYHKDTNLAQGWILGSDFNQKDLEQVKSITGVNQAQLRTKVPMVTTDKKPMTLYLVDENQITKPYTVEGDDFDMGDSEGIWINNRFAEVNNIRVGDKFPLYGEGFATEKTVRGMIMTPEYEYFKASSDVEPDFSKIGYCYSGTSGFPQMKVNQIIFTTDGESVDNIQDQMTEVMKGRFTTVIDTEDYAGIKMLDSEIEQHELFATVYPPVFLLIVLLAIVTTMNRIITEQRVQIGTLKALGMKTRKIIDHYLWYSVILTSVGSLIGCCLGPIALGPMLNDFMPQTFTMPSWDYGYSPYFLVMAGGLVLICTLASYVSCKNVVSTNTVEILYARAPRKAKRCIFEKLPFWNSLSFTARYNLRSISRSKLRTAMIIFGVTAGSLLTVCAFGARDTIDDMEDWVFNRLQSYKYQLALDHKISEEDQQTVALETEGELVMATPMEIKGVDGKNISMATLTVVEGKDIYNITDKAREVIHLKAGQVALTMKLAQKYNVKEGDYIEWRIMGETSWSQSKVTVISRNPNITGMTIHRQDLEDLGKTFRPTICVTNKEIGKDYTSGGVEKVYDKEAIKETWNAGMDSYHDIVFVFMTVALFLTVIVIYNAGTLSFNERRKELATLKVQGFNQRGLRSLLIKETGMVTVVGLIIGIPAGRRLLQFMFDTNGDAVDYQATVTATSYVLSIVVMLATALIVSRMFARKIKKIDMAQVLKPSE